MLVDGRLIAKKILADVAKQTAQLRVPPKLGVITCAPGPETKQYLELKKQKAEEAGISLIVLELPKETTTEDCISCVNRLAQDCDGVLVQLPLPATIEREQVLDAVPVMKDPDGFAYETDCRSILPPVAAAIDVIAREYSITFTNKKVVILGNGRLVGRPASQYAESKGGEITVLTEDSTDYDSHIKTTDILITGVGKPHFITSNMVKKDVIVFDAGASEDGGLVVGDVDPQVADVAKLFTPVPGGIGPITVATLLNNLIKLMSKD